MSTFLKIQIAIILVFLVILSIIRINGHLSDRKIKSDFAQSNFHGVILKIDRGEKGSNKVYLKMDTLYLNKVQFKEFLTLEIGDSISKEKHTLEFQLFKLKKGKYLLHETFHYW